MAYPLLSKITKKRKAFDADLCLICQENSDQNFVTPKSITSILAKIKEVSFLRQDSISEIIDSSEGLNNLKWHRNCYSSYTSSRNVARKLKPTDHENNGSGEDRASSASSVGLTRSSVPRFDNKKCIICQHDRKKKVRTTYRVCEEECASKLLKLSRERQDDVFVRLSTLSDVNDVFASDLLYHKLCLLSYFRHDTSITVPILQGQQMSYSEASVSSEPPTEITPYFLQLLGEIDKELATKCIELSNLTRRLKELYPEKSVSIDNRLVKKLLIHHYNDRITFTEPINQSKSPIVFKTSINSCDLIESVRQLSEKSLDIEELRDAMKANPFNMKGFVCNDALVSEEFNNFRLPSPWETFFQKLLGSDRTINEELRRRVNSIYMDLYYMVSSSDLTPKHVALAEYVHHYTRSKLLITLLNKLGHCISYSSLKKIDNQAATDIITNNKTSSVPIPSNILRDPGLFLHGAIDNDDFKEETLDGKNTTHVTAMVLYQQAPDFSFSSEARKIPITQDVTNHSGFIPCQVVQKCVGVKDKPEYFPDNSKLGISENLLNKSKYSDLIWVLCRMEHGNESKDNSLPKSAMCPAWTPFNQVVSTSELPITNVGFCTLFPAPPTSKDAVYTVMKNFLAVNHQLGRKYAVLSCDMAIYLIAKLIQLQSKEFDTLYLRIGSFHLAKNWLSIIGIYMTDSGLSDIFIETGVFGENTMKAILKGIHYNRSVRAHKLMYEACKRLQLKLFLEEVDSQIFSNVRVHVIALQKSMFSTKEDVSALFEIIGEDGTQMFAKFKDFLNEKSSSNETFGYWCKYCEMVEVLLDCIRAERDGDWDLHLSAVKIMIPYLLLFNHMNYTRGCVLYLEDMNRLPSELKDSFKRGHFSVKRRAGKFNNVATDHALEQSLIRSSKVQGGLIGITSNENAMLNWCLLYHFKTGICQVLHEFCDIFQDPTGDLEELNHKEWRSGRIERDESDVQLIIKFLNEHDNPFENSSNCGLRNIVSGVVASGEASKYLLNIDKEAETQWKQFEDERCVKKMKGLYTPIRRNKNFSLLTTVSEVNSVKSKKGKDVTNVSSSVMLATQRNFNLQDLLKHELIDYPPTLATENGFLKKSVKSDLMNVIEKDTSCQRTLEDLNTFDNHVHVIDGMAQIHSVSSTVLSKLEHFKDFAEHQLFQVKNIVEKRLTVRVDIVYDRYSNISSTVKFSESSLRAQGKSPLIVKIHNDFTRMPKQWSRYIALPENKKELIKYVANYIMSHVSVPQGKSIVISGGFENEDECYFKDDKQIIKKCESLQNNHIEADTRIFLHVKDAIIQSKDRPTTIIIHSPDTDVFILGISFWWNDFKSMTCQGMWMVVGVGDRKRALGCHLAAESLGELSGGMLALHAFTGCDTTSKVGTKRHALSVVKTSESLLDAVNLLKENKLTSEQLIQLERLYLKIVRKKGKSCDESRYIHFLSNPSAASDISSLPCTSDSFYQHVLRCIAQLYYWNNSTTAIVDMLDLLSYGYYMDDQECLRPRLMTLPPLPDKLTPPCKCKNCSKPSCQCFKKESGCCSYCACKENCRNVFTYESEEKGEEDC